MSIRKEKKNKICLKHSEIDIHTQYFSPQKIQISTHAMQLVNEPDNINETVMGIKGRRVHMIEELSETIISFQRGKETNISKQQSCIQHFILFICLKCF